MKAAVLHALGKAPRYEDFPDPEAGANKVVVKVKAASLKNIDKSMASGTHYDSHSQLPVVCGVDGVGVLDDGTRVFCGGARHPYGMMASRESGKLRIDIERVPLAEIEQAWPRTDSPGRRTVIKP
ncbi:MAG TPA: hypothetical protein VJ865_11450 [Gemmatimonadaceae bacterium]|nr:hypothetical protein [Gemmatimonadaceae bacterium]